VQDIPFTFGIITDASDAACDRLNKIVDSIEALKIPEYQIILVGDGKKLDARVKKDVIILDFNESHRPKWITKKKNLITKRANYENIAYSHDYISYDINWYNGWKKYGSSYHAAMNKMVNMDGGRYRDWTIFQDIHSDAAVKYAGANKGECLLPYDVEVSRYQYLSGAYFAAKRDVMMEFPFDENLLWGHGEDLEWAYRFRRKYKFSMNQESSVHLMTPHHAIFDPVRPEVAVKLQEYQAKEFP